MAEKLPVPLTDLTFFPNHRVRTWCDVCGQEVDCIGYEYRSGNSWRSGDACRECQDQMLKEKPVESDINRAAFTAQTDAALESVTLTPPTAGTFTEG